MKLLSKERLMGMELTPLEGQLFIKWFAETGEDADMINERVRNTDTTEEGSGRELVRLLDRVGGDPGLKPASMSFDTKFGPVLVTMERMVGASGGSGSTKKL